MSFVMRLPRITAGTAEGQVQEMKSYLYQMAQELEFALNALEGQQAAPVPVEKNVGREQEGKFQEIKSLIIKSADIVNAYYDQMNEKFRGSYVAFSDFGVFREETEQEIRKNAQGIAQIFGNAQQLGGRLDGIDGTLAGVAQGLAGVTAAVQEVKAVIRTGLLYDDGVPVYGMEIGQQVAQDGVEVFRKFCRLMADRLSFYDAGGNEVAYLSDNRMHVTDIAAETVTAGGLAVQRVQLGDYLLALGADGHLSLS